MTVISGPVTERVEHNTPASCTVYPLVSLGRVIHIMEDRQVLVLIFFFLNVDPGVINLLTMSYI